MTPTHDAPRFPTLLDKPEYFFQPIRLLRRLCDLAFVRTAKQGKVRLPWGGEIEAMPGDSIDRVLHRSGVFDLIVMETLWRLAQSGSIAVDCGANIGYMNGLLARRLARKGTD